MAAAGAAAVSLGVEEKILLARASTGPRSAEPGDQVLPQGKIGKASISRLICGGNLINGYAHSRDLAYVSDLMKHYFTDEKVIETLEICERNGIHTLVANNKAGENTVRILNKYRKKGGKIQWLAQVNPVPENIWENIRTAIDNGAVGAFIQGGIGDDWSRSHPELLAEAVAFIRQNGLIAGVAGHQIGVPEACEEAHVNVDFYFKTLNTAKYYCDEPEKTVGFMARIARPWIAYKVLGAGVVDPHDGFRYAFENGADFVCVGMFDFQVADDARIASQLLQGNLARKRPWAA